MLKLIIEDDEGRKTVVPFVRDEITIGRQEGNTIRLTERNVSRRHARLVRQNGHVVVEDLGSYNGVLLNGERIEEPAQLRDGDLIQIGDYDLALQSEVQAATVPSMPAVRGAAEEEEEPNDSDGADLEAEEASASPEDEEGNPPEGGSRNRSTAVIRMDQVEKNRSRRVEELDPEEAPRLLVVSAEFQGQEFACILTEMRIGRTEDNDIALDHRSLSRTHAKLVREDSGEWRIIDMQSANGLTINGESYAQATLSHGDLVELGHVKLRFIGPGQSAEGLAHARSKGAKKPLLHAGVALVLLAAGLGVAWFLFAQPKAPVTPPPQVVDAPPEQPSPPPQTPPTQEQPETVAQPEEPAIPQLEEKLQSAKEALAANDFDLAVDTLDPLQDANGQHPPEVEQLLEQARAEQQARQSLELARKELQAGRPKDAMKYLEASAGTFAFAAEHAELKQKVEEALAPPPSRPSPRANANTGRRSPAEEARRLYDDGTPLLRKQQLREAESIFKKCIAVDPTYAPCYMVLGATVARRGRVDEGARYYREFLKLAPEHEMADSVRKLLADYEKSKNRSGATQ
ncbi:MAG TPA: FHA domain-containing protein [Myxococcaceae bacterium]|nr:FHA domain-containing protein [Myxococcaceae bacterium]